MVQRTIILLGILLVMSPIAYALSCQYDPEPYLNDKVEWNCILENSLNFTCISYITSNGTELLAVYPNIKDLDLVGRIDYFESRGRTVNIYFGNTDVYPENNYNYSVLCASKTGDITEQFTAVITPAFTEEREYVYWYIWIVDNMGYIVGIILLLIIIGMIVWGIFK